MWNDSDRSPAVRTLYRRSERSAIDAAAWIAVPLDPGDAAGVVDGRGEAVAVGSPPARVNRRFGSADDGVDEAGFHTQRYVLSPTN